MKKTHLLLLLVFSFLLPSAVHAEKLDIEALRNAMDASRKAEGKRLSDYELVDQDGVRFRLGDYLKGGKPLVLSFIYTSCPDVCPTITAEFKRAIDAANDKFGGKFNVLNIAFDPENDTPRKLREYGLRYTVDFKGFRFATSDADTIKRLTSEAGFFYAKKDDGGFDHIDMATVVRPDGTIYKQVYGIRSGSAEIVERLDELITGKPPLGSSASLIEKVKFFCYRYDPDTGRYVVDYPVLAAIFMQTLVIVIIIYAVWGRKFKGLFEKIFRN